MDDGDGGGRSTYVDSSVGTVVWVRRRNGRWWPGRVISAQEVRRSRLLTNRSGTPVKLLGKDNASVDWYNFGTSRRIKAFRCGEFDDCIAKASSALEALSQRSREINKNARREDAILQALEYERKQMESNGLSAQNRLAAAGHAGTIEEAEPVESNIMRDPKASGSSAENVIPHALEKDIDSEWEDEDSAEVIPRMKDLQDFGTTPTEKFMEADHSLSILEVPLPMFESRKIEVFANQDGTNCCPSLSCVESLSHKPSLKRMKCKADLHAEDTGYKRRNRRKPLTQVLKYSAKLVNAPQERDYGRPLMKLEESAFTRMYDCAKREEAMSVKEEIGFECSSKSHSQPLLGSASYLGSKMEGQIHASSCTTLSRFQHPMGLTNFGALESLHVLPSSACSLGSATANAGSLSSVNIPSSDKQVPNSLTNDNGLHSYLGLVSSSEAHSHLHVSHTSSFYGSRDKGFEEYSSALNNRLADCIETSPTVPATDVNGGSISSQRRLQPEGFLSSSECITGEDEAESLQASGSKGKEAIDESASCSHAINRQIEVGGIRVKWQTKGRRSLRASGRCRQVSLCRVPDMCLVESKQVQMKNNVMYGWGSSHITSSTFEEPGKERKLDINAAEVLESSLLQQFCKEGMLCNSVHEKHSFLRSEGQGGLGWVDVPIQNQPVSGDASASCVSLVSRFDYGICIVGYPVTVEKVNSWRQADSRVRRNSGRRTSRGIPRRQVLLANIVASNSLQGAPASMRPRFGPQKPRSFVQKTRTLSSLVLENVQKVVDKESSVWKASERPLVTCIPVHTIFSRIREALFKPAHYCKAADPSSSQQMKDSSCFEAKEPSRS